jgi:beta-glucosidase-like glycosyl hydrolase
VLAVEAGCDGLLICSGDTDLQVQALEALIHAVEDDRLALVRIEDALKRQQKAKERFLAARSVTRPLGSKALGLALGTDEHRAIAGEMARFA